MSQRRMCVQVMVQFTMLLLFIPLGSCLQCYKCYGATKHCYSGNPNYMGILNCSSANEVCATFQYEMDDSVRSYVLTIRGCQPVVEGGICKQLMKTTKTKTAVQKGVLCQTCESDLCNSSASIKLARSSIPMIVLFFIFRLYMST